jgi:hypothetical protein
VHQWNHEFWTAHNIEFRARRKGYVAAYQEEHGLGKKDRVPAAGLAEFHREFLDDYRVRHADYNFAWWKLNFELTYLSVRAYVGRFLLDRKVRQDAEKGSGSKEAD